MMLDVRDVSVSFGSMAILDHVSLTVGKGAVVGLIGPNGAGKSTLFSVLSGFITPDRGRVFLEGVDISAHSTVARARLGLIRTFQVPREFKSLTVRENLMVSLRGHPGERIWPLFLRWPHVRSAERERARQVDRMLEMCALTAVADLPANQLSGGQKKLLELGRAAIQNPPLLLLDEPFNGVNPVMIERLSEAIRALNRDSTSFLIVEHNLPALAQLTDFIYVLDRGRLIASGSAREVLSERTVQAAYLGAGEVGDA